MRWGAHIMSDDLTPERVAILVEFADSVAAGKRAMRWLAWLGAVATGIATLVYYVGGILRNAR